MAPLIGEPFKFISQYLPMATLIPISFRELRDSRKFIKISKKLWLFFNLMWHRSW